jgi:hypothetical protein
MSVITTATPYCSPLRLLDFVDHRIVADCLVDNEDEPRPSRLAILNSNSVPGIRLIKILLAASGELEEACVGAAGYKPDLLSTLTGAMQANLERIVAGLAIYGLFSRRQPASAKIEDVPAASYAQERLLKLQQGIRIFGFSESLDAAGGMEAIEVTEYVRRTENKTSTAARRYFGRRSYEY